LGDRSKEEEEEAEEERLGWECVQVCVWNEGIWTWAHFLFELWWLDQDTQLALTTAAARLARHSGKTTHFFLTFLLSCGKQKRPGKITK
jgi:hypothetical protein